MPRCAQLLSTSVLLFAPLLALGQPVRPGTLPPSKPGVPPMNPAMNPGGVNPGGAFPGPAPNAPTMPAGPPSTVGGHDYDFWVRKLNPETNRDAAVRELAIHMIPQFGKEKLQKAMPHIIKRLLDGDPAVKFNAMMLICHSGIDDLKERDLALRYLFNPETGMIMSSNEMLRLAAVNGAAHIGPPAYMAIPALIGQAHLTNPNSYEARKAAAAALGQIAYNVPQPGAAPGSPPTVGPDKRAITALIERLADPCLAVRIEVAHSLMLLGRPTDEKDVVAERNMLMGRIGKDGRTGLEPDKSLKLWLRVALIRLGDNPPTEKDLDPICESLRSTDQFERINAAQALGVMGKVAKAKAGALRAGLEVKSSTKVEDFDFLYMCLWSMGMMGTDAQIFQQDIKELITTHPDPAVKKMAAETLAKVRGLAAP
jgi:HEAT repeat protein